MPSGRPIILRTVANICGRFTLVMAVAMVLPATVDLLDGNPDWSVFLHSALFAAVPGGLVMLATQSGEVRFSPRLGFLLTTALWLDAALVGALPIYFSPLKVTFAGAFFEAMSGITTTGSTVLSGLDTMPRGILLWRSILQWLGGVGFIALALLLLPSLRVGGIRLFHMESSDKSEKILPRVNQIAAGIVIAYVGLSALCAISYFAAGMTMFEAVNHAMTTLATGGYSTHDASMGYYADNRAMLVIATVFMALAGLPFILFVKAVMPRRLRTLADPQVTLFFSVIAIATVVLAIIQRIEFNTKPIDALVTSAFNFVSVLTTTGYASEDYTRWGSAAIGIFLIAYFLGGCAGSTAGGIKMNRAVILWRVMRTSLARLITPHAVVKTRYGRDEVSTEAAQTVLVFFFLFIATLVFGTMALMLLGHEFVTAFSSAITALSNVGPGLGEIVGPSGNFSSLDDPSLWIMSYLMLAGRLEIVTVMILMTPVFWSR